MLVKAGAPVDKTIESLVPYLEVWLVELLFYE